uniref:Uncharacterized protein n=1 Tax=Tetranychus urticae TaxID=32264 RepID=T1K1U2_TETUR
MESTLLSPANEVVKGGRTRRSTMEKAAEYPLIGVGIMVGLAVVANGIYRWRKTPEIVNSAWLQRYRVGSSAPIVIGALLSAMMETPEKRRARKERYS